MNGKIILGPLVASLVFPVLAISTSVPGVSPGPGTRYATDCYPGFDNESEIVAPSKKEPRWFSWWNGPVCDNAKDQFAYCEGLVAGGDFSKAAKQFDALVREWPVAPEASVAQAKYAELLLTKLDDPEEAFAQYRYLADFYSIKIDYTAITDKMYSIACLMRKEGKDFAFFHFDNTVDVRRAFEACVLRAPGAKWVREAMLVIGDLRIDEGKFSEAIRVYENLRNLHAGSAEAREAYYREAKARMTMLDDHGYNRSRCLDTINYLMQALRNVELDKVDEVKEMLTMAKGQMEDEAYRSAKFYDSPTRTVRSAVNAYEQFLAEYPESKYAAEAKERLERLKGRK